MAVSPVAGATFQGPEHHDTDPVATSGSFVSSGSVHTENASQNSGMCTGSFCHHWLPAPTSKHTAHITLYPLSQVFSGRAVSTCARHCWATSRGSEGPRTAGGAQSQQAHGLGSLLLGSQGPWRPVRGIRHSDVRVHKNQPHKRLFGERDSY